MGGLKEIRRRITSVNNTRQITRAMKLVSAAKLRRAQDSAESGRAYSDRLNDAVRAAISDLTGEFEHPLLEQRKQVNTRRVIMISGDRGLCGAYNANVLKAVIANDVGSGPQLEFVAVGRRSASAVRSQRWNAVSTYEDLSEDAADWPIDGIARSAMRDFIAGRCDEVVLYYTKFVSAMTQEVTREVLLPFGAMTEAQPQEAASAGGYMSYSPSPEEILSGLIPLLVRTRIAQGALESKASEHAARMTAMDSATSNASELIDKLRLYYNRARQSAITTELIDIVGGAEATK